jgi:hypothetical protein
VCVRTQPNKWMNPCFSLERVEEGLHSVDDLSSHEVPQRCTMVAMTIPLDVARMSVGVSYLHALRCRDVAMFHIVVIARPYPVPTLILQVFESLLAFSMLVLDGTR